MHLVRVLFECLLINTYLEKFRTIFPKAGMGQNFSGELYYDANLYD